MNWLTVLFGFFLKTRSENSKLEIKQVYVFENNFWQVSNTRSKGSGIGDYLYAFGFVDGLNEKLYQEFDKDDCFYLDRTTGKRYVELHHHCSENLYFFLNSSEVEKNFIRIQFHTTDRPINDFNDYYEFRNYKGKKYYFETHMWAENPLNDDDGIIKLKFDKDKSRNIYIKKWFKQLVGKRFDFFDEFIYKSGRENPLEKLERNKDFELCHFSNYRECYQNLKTFLGKIQFCSLTDRYSCDKKPDDTKMHPATFMQRIDKMIKEELEKLSGDSEKSMPDKFCTNVVNFFYESKDVFNKKAVLKTYKLLMKKCFDDLTNKMQGKNLFININGKYDVDYYFKELYNQASKAVKTFQEKYEVADADDKEVIFLKICDSFNNSIKKLQEKKDTTKELFELESTKKFHLSLLRQEVEGPDYIFFDYLNMLTYFSFLCYISSGRPYISTYDYPLLFESSRPYISTYDYPFLLKSGSSYISTYDYPLIFKSGRPYLSFYNYPIIFNYSVECKIVKCLKIQLKTCFSNGFGKIEAFDEKDEKIEFKKNVHFFIRKKFDHKFYCSLEVLRKLKIKKIKITTLQEDLCKTIEVDDYLSN